MDNGRCKVALQRVTCLLRRFVHSWYCIPFSTQREELLASHKARGDQLEKLLLDAKQRVADHHSGTRLLTEEELAQLEKKVDVFTKKIEKMRKIPDEQEVERILAREREIKRRHEERRKMQEEL